MLNDRYSLQNEKNKLLRLFFVFCFLGEQEVDGRQGEFVIYYLNQENNENQSHQFIVQQMLTGMCK